jgi:hypothetical protein
MIRFHVTPTFKIVHRSGGDRAQNYLSSIEHREINDHSIKVVSLDLASLQQHSKCSISDDFHARQSPSVWLRSYTDGGSYHDGHLHYMFVPI